MIQVSGFSVERFLNMAAYEGLHLWNVRSSPRGADCALKACDLAAAKACAEKTGCTLRLVEEHGLPFLRRRYGKRRLLTGGLLFFLVSLLAASSVLWSVEVSGNDRVSRRDLLAACEEEGLAPGKWKAGVDPKAVSTALLQQFPDLAWVSVSVTGTTAHIRVAETVAPVPMVDRTTPTDVIAREEGVVLSIAASAGTPLVRAGDVVRKGQVLVSSLVEEKDGDTVVGTYYTHARAEITGRVWRAFSDALPLVYEKETLTGEETTNYRLQLGSRVLDVLRPHEAQAHVRRDWQKHIRIGDYTAPLGLEKETWLPYTVSTAVRTEEEAKEILSAMLEAALAASLGPQETAEPYEITYERQGETLTARTTVPILCSLGEETAVGEEREEPN